MDLKRYEKTRYQNIYRNKKNKNYMIMISNPKTTIGIVNGKKIFDIEEAKKIRDNPKIRLQKESEIKTKNNFDVSSSLIYVVNISLVIFEIGLSNLFFINLLYIFSFLL